MLRHFQECNASRSRCFAYSLGDRGFFAEITSVARALIYAWARGRRMLLDSRDFAYRYRHGWSDYFEPFCAEPWDVDPTTIEEWIRFTRTGDREPFERLRRFQPATLRFASLELGPFQSIMRHFMRMIFRLTEECREEIERLRRPLSLPAEYAAVHIRRGDKVGDEDVFYPTSRYLEALGPLGDAPLFVMTDDHRSVVEVREELEARGLANRVSTLSRDEHTGFDVWALRAGKTFAGGGRLFDDQRAHRRYVFEETIRLLAETVIATGAARFVSTFESNVGRSVWYLHDDPDCCVLLTADSRDTRQFGAKPPDAHRGVAPRTLEVGFSEPSIEALLEKLETARVVVEYGAGGSTLLAAERPSTTVITVDSDEEHLKRVLGRAVNSRVTGRIVALHADIGPTKEWGHPVDFANWRQFPAYAVRPWSYVREHALRPDLVLIDGRFRVACFLATCASIRDDVLIFVDDYPDRPNYHLVEQVLKPARIVDDRMAIFEARPGLVSAEFLLRHLDVFFRPHH